MKVNGKIVYPGIVEGEVIKYNGNFSFLGGVDPKKGILKDDGRYIGGKIFIFDSSSGSTVGSYIIYGLRYYGHSPLAIVCNLADETLVTGSVMAQIPTLSNVDTDIFIDGDKIKINNDLIEINLEPVEVVTSILYHNGKILILKRSDKVSTYKGKWAGVSGYREDLDPEPAAKREIIEETGIVDPRLIRTGGHMFLRDGKRLWKIYLFLWEVDNENIKIDWEHTEYRWIDAEKIKNFDTVPGLDKAIRRLFNKI
jgi:predicted aconitase with swiveling domain/ADP-ribose pyrophosphatase YjhB (NUDIX family)